MTDPNTEAVDLVGSQSDTERFRNDVLAGLKQPQKTVSCKWLYDEYGSELFDRITELDEYYPTRTEDAIMRTHVEEMARQIGPDCLLIEYGSGSSEKTRILLDHLTGPAAYVALDISEKHLLKSVERLQGEYPGLRILPLAADFTERFQVPEIERSTGMRVVYFPGSTIGNFAPEEVRQLLESIVNVVGPGGGLLLGVDLQKSGDIVKAAYNDREGVTAAFNLNLLRRINRELGANFDIEQFEHSAEYNDELHCIEMRLLSRCDQSVDIGNERVEFRAGESILTERSHKYSLPWFEELAQAAGFEVANVWMDDRNFFSMQYLTAREHGG